MTFESKTDEFLFSIITAYSVTVERYRDRSAAEFPSSSLHFHLRLTMSVLYYDPLTKNITILKSDIPPCCHVIIVSTNGQNN